MDWLTVIITALTSGGLAGFSTIWYSRRKAKADAVQSEAQATQSVQDIYQELIQDLKERWDEQKGANDSLRDQIRRMEDRISKLKEDVEKNARRLAWLIPMTCCVVDCKKRVVYTGELDSKPKRKPTPEPLPKGKGES